MMFVLISAGILLLKNLAGTPSPRSWVVVNDLEISYHKEETLLRSTYLYISIYIYIQIHAYPYSCNIKKGP